MARKHIKATCSTGILDRAKMRGEVFRKHTTPTLAEFGHEIKRQSSTGLLYSRRAMGLSAKFEKQATDEDMRAIEEDARSVDVAELHRRFLLSCGSEAQGTMANKVGNDAKNHVKDCIELCLMSSKIEYEWIELEGSTRKGKYCLNFNDRIMLFDTDCPIVDCNLDYMLLKFNGQFIRLHEPSDYLAIGELKGGKDPAAVRERCKESHSTLAMFNDRAKINPVWKRFIIFDKVTQQVADDLNSANWWDEFAYLNSKKELRDLAKWLVGM